MVKTGDYLIQYYSRIGTKIKALTETAESLEDAKEIGEETIIIEEVRSPINPPVSITIDRRVYNSLDRRLNKWGH